MLTGSYRPTDDEASNRIFIVPNSTRIGSLLHKEALTPVHKLRRLWHFRLFLGLPMFLLHSTYWWYVTQVGDMVRWSGIYWYDIQIVFYEIRQIVQKLLGRPGGATWLKRWTFHTLFDPRHGTRLLTHFSGFPQLLKVIALMIFKVKISCFHVNSNSLFNIVQLFWWYIVWIINIVK